MSDKPHITYAAFRASLPPALDLDSLEWEKTPLYLGTEEVVYAGHHGDTLLWLKRKNKVECYRQVDVLPHLRLRP